MAFPIDFSEVHIYPPGATSVALPVDLRYGGRIVDLVASVDTGASHCLFERSFADSLGIDLESGVRSSFATANSRFEAFGHDVTIAVGGIEVYSQVFFFADSEITKNVLGRRGWLDRLKFGVIDYDERVYLAHYGEVH